MATQKEMREIRENVIEQVQEVEFENFQQIGQIVDGVLLFNLKTQSYLVLKPIAKKDSFDADDALIEFEDKEKARIERETAKAEKLAKVEKEKEEKEE